MNLALYFVYFAVGVNIIGTLHYAHLTVQGKIQPNRVTWLIWSLAPIVAAVIAFLEGVGIAALPVFIAGVGPLIIFFATFFNRNAYWKLGRFDYSCGALSLIAFIFWLIVKDPLLAIVLTILADFLAFIPTLIKTWKFPETESSIAFFGALLGAISGLFVVENWVFVEYGFLVYLMFICTSFIILVNRKSIIRLYNA